MLCRAWDNLKYYHPPCMYKTLMAYTVVVMCIATPVIIKVFIYKI